MERFNLTSVNHVGPSSASSEDVVSADDNDEGSLIPNIDINNVAPENVLLTGSQRSRRSSHTNLSSYTASSNSVGTERNYAPGIQPWISQSNEDAFGRRYSTGSNHTRLSLISSGSTAIRRDFEPNVQWPLRSSLSQGTSTFVNSMTNNSGNSRLTHDDKKSSTNEIDDQQAEEFVDTITEIQRYSLLSHNMRASLRQSYSATVASSCGDSIAALYDSSYSGRRGSNVDSGEWLDHRNPISSCSFSDKLISGQRRSHSDMAAAASQVATLFQDWESSQHENDFYCNHSIVPSRKPVENLCKETSHGHSLHEERPTKRHSVTALQPKSSPLQFDDIGDYRTSFATHGCQVNTVDSHDNFYQRKQSLRDSLVLSSMYIPSMAVSTQDAVSATTAAFLAASAAESNERRLSQNFESSPAKAPASIIMNPTNGNGQKSKSNSKHQQRKMRRRVAFSICNLDLEASSSTSRRMDLLMKDRADARMAKQKVRNQNTLDDFDTRIETDHGFDEKFRGTQNSGFLKHNRHPAGRSHSFTSGMSFSRHSYLGFPDDDKYTAACFTDYGALQSDAYLAAVHEAKAALVDTSNFILMEHERRTRGEIPTLPLNLNYDDTGESVSEEADTSVSSPPEDETLSSFDGKMSNVFSFRPRTEREQNLSRAIYRAAATDDKFIKAIIQNFKDYTRLSLDWSEEIHGGEVAIHVAARHGSLKAIHSILAMDKDCALIRNNMGHVALHDAVKTGNFAAVSAICGHCSSSARIQCEEGCLPLHDSVSTSAHHQDAPQIAAVLLAAYPGAVDVTTDEGLLPVHLAAMSGFSAGLRTIMAYGFHTIYTKENTEFMLPLDFSVDGLTSEKDDHSDVEDVLLSVVQQQSLLEKVSTTNLKSNFSGCIEILLMSALNGSPVLSPRDHLFLPLHGAIISRPLLRTWKTILNLYGELHGSDVDTEEQNPLHYLCASRLSDEEYDVSLLNSMALRCLNWFDRLDKNGFLPLHLALLERPTSSLFIACLIDSRPATVSVEVPRWSRKLLYRGLLPFQLAAISDCDVGVIYSLLRSNPSDCY